MLHPETIDYTFRSTVSRRNFTNREGGIGAPKPARAEFLELLSKFITLRGGNQSLAGRDLRVKHPQDVNRWLQGKGPTTNTLNALLPKLRELVLEKIGEEPDLYVKKLSVEAERILARVERLLEMTEDKKIIASLEGHLDLLEEIVEHRRKKIIREDPPPGQIPPQERLAYEFRGR